MKFKLLVLAALFAFMLPFGALADESREDFDEAVGIVNLSGPAQLGTQTGVASAVGALLLFAASHLWLDEPPESKANELTWHLLPVPNAQMDGPRAAVRFIMTW